MVADGGLGAAAGRLSARIGAWRSSAVGLVVAAAGHIGIAATITSSGYITRAFVLALWGAGLGILTPAIVSAALQAIPGAHGLASGASNTSRQTGGALGIALFGAIAGPANRLGFIPQSIGLFVGAAVLFVLTSVLCLGMTRGGRTGWYDSSTKRYPAGEARRSTASACAARGVAGVHIRR